MQPFTLFPSAMKYSRMPNWSPGRIFGRPELASNGRNAQKCDKHRVQVVYLFEIVRGMRDYLLQTGLLP